MALLRKSAVAVTMISAGLASTAGIAFADDHHDDDHGSRHATVDSYKLVDLSDSNNASGLGVLCDLDAAQLINFEDNTASVPVDVAKESKDSPEAHAPGAKSTCSPDVKN